MKKITIVAALSLISALFSCKDDDDNVIIATEYSKTISLLDKSATAETKALYSNLWKLQIDKKVMYGHHDDLIYGRHWYAEQGRSDTKDVVGDYAGVFSVDFSEIMDDRSTTSELNIHRVRAIKEARERGEVITAVMHLNNPYTGGDSWDNNANTVKEILKVGSSTNVKFMSWLDKLATFANTLKDAQGRSIPIIFRPFHEHTQTWSWWGSSATTEQDFLSLWRLTVDYLKDTKGVHNFIYAISPQLDSLGSKDSYLYRWPGDQYVDFIGVDSYHGVNTAAFSSNLRNLGLLSKEMGKPCGVTETGVEGIRSSMGKPLTKYWTDEIGAPISNKGVSMVVLWRNKYDPTEAGHHYYAPYKGEATASNFIEFYNLPHILFSKDLPNMYVQAEGITVN